MHKNSMLAIFAAALFPLSLVRAEGLPRPSFFPATPPVSKAIADYTPADVVGVISTRSDELPEDHPYVVGGQYMARLKAEWPGATDANQIDRMIEIGLDAPASAEPREEHRYWNNLRFVLRNAMKVGDDLKVQALLRVVNAQTDPVKKAAAIRFASSMFDEFLDPALFALRMPQLDDDTKILLMPRGEEGGRNVYGTLRFLARQYYLGKLAELELTPKFQRFPKDEAADCASLKTWLTTNRAQIETKCAAEKADPGRRLPSSIISPFDSTL